MADGRKFFVGGNWKMNGNLTSIDDLLEMLNTRGYKEDVEVVVAPPLIYTHYVRCRLDRRLGVAAQNCYKESSGAFTGEISPEMVLNVGAAWSLIGHSERRNIFGETDSLLAEKVVKALSAGLSVIPCIGENLEQRDSGMTSEICYAQLEALFADVEDKSYWKKIVIAYEPIWAIGTGKTATPEQAQSVHMSIRQWVANKIGNDVAEGVRILYGGSVKAGNCKELAKQPDIDGFLVGGASLKPEFIDIIHAND